MSTNTVRLPAWKHAYDLLKQKSEFGPGFVVGKEWLAVIFGAPVDSPAFARQLIPLWHQLRVDGLFPSQRKCPGGIRLVLAKDAADHVRKSTKKYVRHSAENAVGLSKVSRSGLTQMEAHRLDHTERMAGIFAVQGSALLRKRKLPSPSIQRVLK